MPDRKIHAHFIEPMLLLRTETLPTGSDWMYELKFDGFRSEAIKTGGNVHPRSRNASSNANLLVRSSARTK